MRYWLILGFVAILMLANAQMTSAQEEGRGVVRLAAPGNLDTDVTSFNPLRCADPVCEQAVSLLFPTLFAIDPQTRWFEPATQSSGALVTSWEMGDDNLSIMLTLRDDAQWSDGTSMTAYDVFYSYLALSSGRLSTMYNDDLDKSVTGMIPLSDTSLLILLEENNCDTLPLTNIPIAPSHVFAPDFADQAAAFFDNDDPQPREQWSAWDDAYMRDYEGLIGHAFDSKPNMTGERFAFDKWLRGEYLRLRHDDLRLEFVPVVNQDEAINRVLAGELSAASLPYDRWHDVEAAQQVRTYSTTGPYGIYLAFNLADPENPESAYDEDGNALEQGMHPILGDVRVRRAIQLAIDPQALIDSALQGQGSVMPGNLLPATWWYDDQLAPIGTDIDTAKALLEEAGWVQVADRSIRECVGCAYDEEGRRLYLSLISPGSSIDAEVGTLIVQQLARIGIAVAPSNNIESTNFQYFDMAIQVVGEANDRTTDRSYSMFLPENDVLNSGENISSYNNPEVTELLHQAQTVPGCELEARRAYLHEAQRIIQQDQPAIWLLALNDTLAVHESVQNVEVVPNALFYNLSDWRVWR